MKIENLAVNGVKLITPKIIRDERGFFSETWAEKALADLGLEIRFVQDNHALSITKGTVRGLHFQTAPKARAVGGARASRAELAPVYGGPAR